MPLAKNQIIEVEISNLSNDGNGVARYDGRVVFVAHAAVGDLLQVKITKLAKTHAFGQIHQIVSSGKERISSACPVSSKCGGCSFQHITYKGELAAKQGFVQDATKRIGKFNFEVSPIIPSPQESRYRNKVQYPVALGSDNLIAYGFYAPRSHRVVPCNNCLLQPEIINKIASHTASLLEKLNIPPYEETTQKGVIRHIYLRIGVHTNEIMLCLVSNEKQIIGIQKMVDELVNKFKEIKTIIINYNPKTTNVICGDENNILFGAGFINEKICDVPIKLGPLSFSQVNTFGAERLFEIVKNYASPTKQDNILDLYCGAGVIGLSMAKQCASLTGVEIVESAVQSAKESAELMGIADKCRFLCEDASACSTRFASENFSPSICIIDPPRKGSDEATLRALLSMAPKKIIMVSCNPATMARDVSFLVENNYIIKHIQPVDMFPRTKHVEAVVLLVAK